MRSVRPAFLSLWTLAVAATVSAFVVHLALREVHRVLELEASSYKTPERVEFVARSLLGMEPPPPERIVAVPAVPAQAALDPTAAPSVVGLNGVPARPGPP